MRDAVAIDPETGSHADQARLHPLVTRMADGDEAALAALYQATSARVHGLALRILGARDAAEEVVVDVYAQAWRLAPSYDPSKGSVATWLCVQARTRAIDLRRSRGRHRALQPLEDGEVEPTPDPSELSVRTESATNVRRALRALPREQRRLVEAAFFGGMTHSEIAEAFGQPLGTVKTRIRAGLAALRRALALLEQEFA
jgi:RNA polymerase sigma-70 factor (ECF subfamily)